MKYLLYLPVILISYAIGSVSMAHFLSGRKGFDIREKGSGNMGASNAMITMGWGAGVITALFDMAKAALCVFAADRLLGETLPCVGAVAGVAAIIGHIFPFYLQFKGGKGLACFLGTTLALDWRVFLGALVIVAAITLITDYIAIGTLTAAIAVPIALSTLHRNVLLGVIVFIGPVIMFIKHRDNFKRIKEGTEIGFIRARKGEGRVK